MRTLARFVCPPAAVLAAALALGPVALHAAPRRVEVAEVEGLIDAPVVAAVRRALAVARSEGAEALVLQIDSRGGIDEEGVNGLVRELLDARVPVVTWIGPPGARAEGAAAVLASAGHVVAMSPGSRFGPAHSVDLRTGDGTKRAVRAIVNVSYVRLKPEADVVASLGTTAYTADRAEDEGLVDVVAVQLPDLLRGIDGKQMSVAGAPRTLRTNPEELSVRFHKMGLLGRLRHAVAQPSIAYLLLLLGLVGVVFELFHPSTGPAGVSGALALLLSGYSIAVLGGSWFAAALVVAGVAAMCVDLRVQGLGVFTASGIAAMVAGSILLFGSPRLRPPVWVIAFGIGSMVAFMLGAMTRVLSDLRAVAGGELEVTDPVEQLHRTRSEDRDD